ncbi:xylulose kinase, partial [Micromonospora purpureochromogenes]
AARQAAWVALGGAAPPEWADADTREYDAEPVPAVRERYAQARDRTVDRTPG